MPDRPLLSVVRDPGLGAGPADNQIADSVHGAVHGAAPAGDDGGLTLTLGAAGADSADVASWADTAALVDSRRAPRAVRGRLVSSAARLAVLVGVAAVGALAVGPRLLDGDLPVEAALIGSPARTVLRADRDYALVDEEATESQRRAAADRVTPLWDLDDERARRDAGVVQRALVRVAVALEAQRRSFDYPPTQAPPSVRVALEPVRAVVAGELADVGLEAPRDDAWQALLAMAWAAPGSIDALATTLSTELARPIVSSGQRGLLPSGAVTVRGIGGVALGAGRDERVVPATDLLDEVAARAAAQAAVLAALAAATSASAAATAADAVAGWAALLPRPNLTWNAAETESRRRAARASTPVAVVRAQRGEIVLRPGEPIVARHVLLARAMDAQQGERLRRRATLGTATFIALVCGVIYLFGARRVFQRRLRTRDVVFLGGLVAVQLALLAVADALAPVVAARVPGATTAVVAFAVPIAFGPMCARVTLPPDVALLLALASALLGGVVVEAGMAWAVVAALSSMTGAALVMRGPRRWTILLAGIGAGAVGVATALTVELFRGALAGAELVALLAATACGGVLAGGLAMVGVPLVERAFGYITDGRLYRLADLNHPLLKDLIVHAPGTWHHSVRTAVLAERAAAVVGGASPLLARVMALYHDAGNIAQPGAAHDSDAAHAHLPPHERAALRRAHVDEGLALARRHGIPEAVAAVIREHHADVVMEPLLALARAQAAADDAVDERVFRFAGTAPRSREAALVMLADQIENTSRALHEPSAERQDVVVDAIVNRALALDLLAACDLSLRDLGRARAALKQALRDLQRGAPGAGLERRTSEGA